MTKLSPSAQAIIDAGRAAQSPSAATKASVLSNLDHALMEPAAASASGLAQASGKAGLGKVLIGSALVVALGVGYFLLRSESDTRSSDRQELVAETAEEAPVVAPTEEPAGQPAATLVPAEAAMEDLALIEEAALETAPAPAPEQSPVLDKSKTKGKSTAKRHREPALSAADSLLAEQKLIGAAQRATRDGDYAAAKSLLAEHLRDFKRGVLAPERKAVSAITSCLAGELDKGQQAAEKFLESHARSPLANQVRKSCQLP